MAHFEDEIARAVVLALFVPLIITSGGNSGSQASTLVIRAMALGEVRLRDWWRVIRRELASGLALGLSPRRDRPRADPAWQALFGLYGEHYLPDRPHRRRQPARRRPVGDAGRLDAAVRSCAASASTRPAPRRRSSPRWSTSPASSSTSPSRASSCAGRCCDGPDGADVTLWHPSGSAPRLVTPARRVRGAVPDS